MRFGSLWGAGFGSPDNQLLFFEPTLDAYGGLSVRLQAAAGFGDAYFGVYANTKRIGLVYLPESQVVLARFRAPVGEASLCVLRHGTLADYLMDRPARTYEASTSKKATLAWSWEPEILGTPDLATLSNWSLTGVFPSLTAIGQPATRSQLNASISVVAGVATVTLDNGGDPLATGSGAVGTTVALTGAITGSVDVSGAAATATSPLLFRFPLSMAILRGTVNPPTVVVATVLYASQDTSRWTEPENLAPATYYYKIRPNSDTGGVGAAGSAVSVVIPAPPAAPTGLHYASGGASATVIHWTASATAGASYNLYLQPIGAAFMDLNTPIAIAAGEVSYTLPAIVGYPGTVRLILRAEKSGVEEANLSFFNLEYDAAGAYVTPRPNAPVFSTAVASAGLALAVNGAYATYGEKGVPTKLQLFSRTTSGTYDFTTPDAEGTLTAAGGAIRTATLSKTYLTSGWRYFTLKAANATVQSEGYAPEVLVYLSSVAVAAPTMTAEVSRG